MKSTTDRGNEKEKVRACDSYRRDLVKVRLELIQVVIDLAEEGLKERLFDRVTWCWWEWECC